MPSNYFVYEVALAPITEDEMARLQTSDDHGVDGTATMLLHMDDDSCERNLTSRRCMVADLLKELGAEVYGFAEVGGVTLDKASAAT